VTTLPAWAVWTLAFGSPAVTAVIAVAGEYYGRRGDVELETRSKREEVLRNLRWAAELAVSDDALKATLGLEQLQALRASQMLSPAEEEQVDAALHAAIEGPRQAITRRAGTVEVVASGLATAGVPGAAGDTLVPSKGEAKRAETGI